MLYNTFLFIVGLVICFNSNAQEVTRNGNLFTVIGGPDKPVLDKGMPGTEDILGGFEGGTCVKIDGIYHLFPTEQVGKKINGKDVSITINTRLAHWVSKDAFHWKRINTLFESSGTFAVSNRDNPVNDRRSSLWAFMPIFDKEQNRWNGFYVAYTVDTTLAPPHGYGRIWRSVSKVPGINGIGGPYIDSSIILEPGMDSQLWEGRQGVDSFYPFRVGEKWFAFYGGAFPFYQRSDYPVKGHFGKWYVGLASADKLFGPWERMDTIINPITEISSNFVENPIVSQLPNGLYIAIFDSGPENYNGFHFPNKIAYTISKDGIHWTPAEYIPIEEKVKRWWKNIRTPLCLIPEGDNIYTLLYSGTPQQGKFQPINLVKLRLNLEVMESYLINKIK
ncbi:MAG: hypothetical protein ABI325_08895 [Ginsengibacter sp.]